jgi:hypothetical protein
MRHTGAPRVLSTAALLLIAQMVVLPSFEAVASPQSDYTVGIDLERQYVEMLVSSEHDVHTTIQGWVAVNDMRVGETVSVDITCTGGYYIYAGADPPHHTFDRDGRKYFNLTVTLVEDAGVMEESGVIDEVKLVVTAVGKTYIDQAVSDVELVVRPVLHITADAQVLQQPGPLGPGEDSKGLMRISNTGEIIGQYRLEIASDPDEVLFEAVFVINPSVGPGDQGDFQIRITTHDDAEPGRHQVTVELWALTQYDTGRPMDTFVVRVEVEDQGMGVGTSTVVLPLLLVVAIAALATYRLRRKA